MPNKNEVVKTEETPVLTALILEEKNFDIEVKSSVDVEKLFVEKDGLKYILDKITTLSKKEPSDVTTEKGKKAIKSTARKVASVKKKLDDVGKQIVADMKAKPKAIDANRKAMREYLETLQAEIRKPIDEIEEREARIAKMLLIPLEIVDCTSEEIQEKSTSILNVAILEEEWKESFDSAVESQKKVVDSLIVMYNDKKKAEDDVAELIRLQAEEEERKKKEEIKRLADERAAKIIQDNKDEQARQRSNEMKPYIVFIRDYHSMLNMDEVDYQKELSEIQLVAKIQWDEEAKEQEKLNSERMEQEAKERIEKSNHEKEEAIKAKKEERAEPIKDIKREINIAIFEAIEKISEGNGKIIAAAIIRNEIPHLSVNHGES